MLRVEGWGELREGLVDAMEPVTGQSLCVYDGVVVVEYDVVRKQGIVGRVSRLCY